MVGQASLYGPGTTCIDWRAGDLSRRRREALGRIFVVPAAGAKGAIGSPQVCGRFDRISQGSLTHTINLSCVRAAWGANGWAGET